MRKLGSRGGAVFVDESAESVSALDAVTCRAKAAAPADGENDGSDR
jgi:hypothetical protein